MTLVAPSVLPQEAVAMNYSSHSEASQEQQLEDCAALLREEIFSVILGTVNMQHGTVSKNWKNKSDSDYSDDEVFQLTQVPDTPITGSSHGYKVTFRNPVVRLGSISSTCHLVPQPVFINVLRIPKNETFRKDTDNEMGVRIRTPHQKVKRMREDISVALHSLWLLAKEFRKILEPKIQKHKGRYSANVMLVFNSWLRDIEIYMKEQKLTNMEAVQVVKITPQKVQEVP